MREVYLSLKKKLLYLCIFILLGIGIGVLTIPESKVPYSKILYSSDGQLLSARLARDEQWRFEPSDSIPYKYSIALKEFEDRYFNYHIGINPISIFKAFYKNLKAKKIIAGGSTISMQNIRLRRGFDKKRSIGNKILEIYWAIALELKYSKKKILKDYASRAPFGTNVIGIEAACWRYFKKPSHLLSWAEATLLAVLPNSPSLIHPGKNRSSLIIKRNKLLNHLYQKKIIDTTTYNLSLLEEIPSAPKPLPNMAPHAIDYLIIKYPLKNSFYSTIEYTLQNQINDIADWNYTQLSANKIHNVAILIADTESGNVLAYVGNAPQTIESIHVDHIQAYRSTGSILKPFLYMGANYRGKILPKTLIMDVPSVIDGFQPKNFNLQYQGAVHADIALIQSLNIPFVIMLQNYGLEQFHQDLNKLGLKSIIKPADHYGLSLILGGAESSLWDITSAYASLSRTLIHYETSDHQYDLNDIKSFQLLKPVPKKTNLTNDPPIFSSASIYNTLKVMQEVKRPDESGQWNTFSTPSTISWKTGTSFGFRDAWSIGTNAKYTIGVWVGNSSGEGRPGLLGVKAAAPIMFEALSKLPEKSNVNFHPPLNELIALPICKESGMKPNEYCNQIDTVWACRFQNISPPCIYHKNIWISNTGFQLNQSCINNEASQKSFFILPALPEYYYAPLHAEYEKIPDLDPRCTSSFTNGAMTMITPTNNSSIYIPADQNGNLGKIIFKLAHRNPETAVYWHLDNTYLNTTRTFHEISIFANSGDHVVTAVDSLGNEISLHFKVLNPK